MPPTICIVGRPRSGKTTLISKLIPEFKKRGYRIGTIKHVTHDFDLDKEGKDSWHHSQAGSECVMLSSPHRIAFMANTNHDLSPVELTRFIPHDLDLVLAEGFKLTGEVKIEVNRHEIGPPVCSPGELMALVTDQQLDYDVPKFAPDEIFNIANLIEQNILAETTEAEVELLANGRPVPLTPFIKSLFFKTLTGLVSSLKGIDQPRNVNISIKKR